MKLILLLSALLNAECSICSIEEQELVLSTVLNRSRIRKMYIEDVIFEKNQYHGVNTKNFIPTFSTINIAAKMLLSGPSDSSVLYFHRNDNKKRTWVNGLSLVKIKTYHLFYKN